MAGASFVLLLTILASCAHISSSTTLCNNANFSSWFDSMLSEYNRDERPKPPPRGDSLPPLSLPPVALAVHLRRVTVLERDSDARFSGDLYYDWFDGRLAWNATEWGCESTMAAAELLWLPDVGLVNAGARSGDVSEMPPALITSSGYITFVPRFDFFVPINLDLQSWPGDKQRIELKFASATSIVLTSDWVQLSVKERQFTESTPSGAWSLTSVTTTVANEESRDILVYKKEKYDVIAVNVVLSRRAPAHSLATVAVFLAAMVELAAATLIPPDMRTPLCACAAFTAALWLSSSLVRIPSATSTPVALWLMGVVCVAAAAASLTAALVGRVARLKVAPPAFVRRVLTSASGLCELMPDQSTPEAESGAWAAAARLMDMLLNNMLRLALLLMLCVYVFS